MRAPDIVGAVADPGSLEPWDAPAPAADPLGFVDRRPYPERLAEARATAAADEAVWTGRARIAGSPCALVASDFDFLAGTMGIVAGERVCAALDRAVAERLPVVGLPRSGGTRMQEGTPAFVQMAAVAAAVRRLRAAGLPYLVHMRHPTTGGVLASWGSLGQVTFAEPGALIALTGPRVIAALAAEPLPEGTQTAERLHARGLVDALVPRDELRAALAAALDVLTPADPRPPAAAVLGLPADAEVDPWQAVQRSRRTDRPGVRELVAACASQVTWLSGDGVGGRDDGCLAALARVEGMPAVVVAADRPPGRRGAALTAAGLRTARRAMGLASELGLPLVSVIDTAGVALTAEAEEGGAAAEVARCLAELSALPAPTLSLLLGEGAGGGALALLPADRVVAAEHAWLAPIAPEGASQILHRTTDRAAELARAQAIASTDLRRLGVVDVVVPDRPEPGQEGAFGARVAATAGAELARLLQQDPAERQEARARRWRRVAATLLGR